MEDILLGAAGIILVFGSVAASMIAVLLVGIALG